MTDNQPGPDGSGTEDRTGPPGESATGVPTTETARALLEEGVNAEGSGDLGRAIAAFSQAARSSDPAVTAEALTRLADALRSRGEWTEAIAAARRGREEARGAGSDLLAAHAMVAEANVLVCRGDFADAKQLFEQVLEVTSDSRIRGLALQNIGSILAQRGELGAAERCFAESFGHFQRAGYRRGEATALNNYGRVSLDRGNLDLAGDLLRQATDAAREAEHGELVALATMNLAEVNVRKGDIATAEDLASEALGFFCGCGNRWREVECLRLIGTINEQRGDLENALGCYERGYRIAEEVGAAMELRSLGECVGRIRRKAG